MHCLCLEMAGRNSTLRIMIETLTGSQFDIYVNKLDTVLSIKWKIFRVEGIPVAQQHLLFRMSEARDWLTLQDLGAAEGDLFRLVVSMRGGPIATRRTLKSPVSSFDDALFDFKEFLECSDDSGAPGRYRIEVHQDGTSVSIFKITIPEELESPGLDTDVSDVREPGWALDKIRENVMTLSKVRELRSKMENLHMKRAKNNQKLNSNFIDINRMSHQRWNTELRSGAEIISEELKSLGLVGKPPSLNKPNAVDKYYTGYENKYLTDKIRKSRRQRCELDELKVMQMSRRMKGDCAGIEGDVRQGRPRFKSDTELSLEMGFAEHLDTDVARQCNVPSTAGDSSRYRLSCLLFPSGDTSRPQTSSEELSSHEDSLETFSLQIESPKLHLDTPVSDSIECLELRNTSKAYPNLKTSSYNTVISQYIQGNSKPPSADINPGSDRRYTNAPLRSTRTFFRSNPALHHESAKPHPCSSTSNLDCSKNESYFNDFNDFQHSCSTSNLEAMNNKKFETPNLTRHSNTEYLDYTGSYENLDRVRITKRENLNYVHNANKNLHRSSESLYRINEGNLAEPRCHRLRKNHDVLHQVEAPVPPSDRMNITAEPRQLLNRDEHRIVKISNSMYRDEPKLHPVPKYRHACLPLIKTPVMRKSLSLIPTRKLHKSSLLVLEAPTVKKQKSSSNQELPSTSNDAINTDEDNSIVSQGAEAAPEEDGDTKPTEEKVKKPPKLRCKVCGKRLNITTVIICRCGGAFCAQHRYAEAHECSYNYKEEGRRQIKQDNPVVTAPKLPKI